MLHGKVEGLDQRFFRNRPSESESVATSSYKIKIKRADSQVPESDKNPSFKFRIKEVEERSSHMQSLEASLHDETISSFNSKSRLPS